MHSHTVITHYTYTLTPSLTFSLSHTLSLSITHARAHLTAANEFPRDVEALQVNVCEVTTKCIICVCVCVNYPA